MLAVLPYRGEFGLTVRYHVPAVRALPRPLVVCHEPGLEALYPDCERLLVDSKADALRRDVYARDQEFVTHWKHKLEQLYPGWAIIAPDRSKKWPERRFVPHPHIPQYVAKCEIVICPRFRQYGTAKNWHRWPSLAATLATRGIRVFAAGLAETSDRRCRVTDAAWNYARPLDATIEAMCRARLVISTDNGLAHLAVLCGAPLLLVGSLGGRVAPGPIQENGRIIHPAYGPIRMKHYYQHANHIGSPIELEPNGWQRPDRVVAHALKMLMAVR